MSCQSQILVSFLIPDRHKALRQPLAIRSDQRFALANLSNTRTTTLMAGSRAADRRTSAVELTREVVGETDKNLTSP
jgi:hypothetical protein